MPSAPSVQSFSTGTQPFTQDRGSASLLSIEAKDDKESIGSKVGRKWQAGDLSQSHIMSFSIHGRHLVVHFCFRMRFNRSWKSPRDSAGNGACEFRSSEAFLIAVISILLPHSHDE